MIAVPLNPEPLNPEPAGARSVRQSLLWVYVLFFGSGFPAIIYQIVWQRALFAIYGINIQSVTIVVSAFLLGLGLGSLAGGAVSKTKRWPLLGLFALAELGTAMFGFVSLNIFHRVAEFTAGASLLHTGLICFFLVVVPTVFMGATLPLLVEHLVRSSQNVGSAVGGLYFVNALGSGAACFLAAGWLMRYLGQSGSVRFGALMNALVATGAVVYGLRARSARREVPDQAGPAERSISAPPLPRLPFPLALWCAAFSGFAALCYEIVWYRLLAFSSEDQAPAFAMLLGAYLFDLALGSRRVQRYSQRNHRKLEPGLLSTVMFASAVLAFLVGPASALAMRLASPLRPGSGWPAYLITLLLTCLAASFFGATFPLMADLAIARESQAGVLLSYLYAANIAGCTLGTLITGFVWLDHWSLFQISLLLLGGGVLSAAVVLAMSGGTERRRHRQIALAAMATLGLVLATRPVFGNIYDRLLYKSLFPTAHFQQVVENCSGVIGVTPDGTVFGGGVYDGRFSTDLLHDRNIIVRPYGLSAFHAAPHHVLMIGLGSGSWAQVVGNHPQVERLTVVEINPGYLELIPQHPAVASLLSNPKVSISIDDGRRWLVRHPREKFDAIVMNTTFHWRNHVSNLLSVEFLQIARLHLEPGGVLFYNTTGSDDVMATGLSVYPYALRFANALAVSDSPLLMDRARWKSVLLRYVIDGRPVVDANDPEQVEHLNEIVNIPEDPTGRTLNSVERNDQLRARLHGRLMITDDNMGLEWRAAK